MGDEGVGVGNVVKVGLVDVECYIDDVGVIVCG